MSKVFEIQNLQHIFTDNGEKRLIFNNFSMTIHPGQICIITGKSGMGKSSLLHILGLLLSPTSGEMWFQNQNLFALSAKNKDQFRKTNIGFVFQNFHLIPDLSVMENVALPLIIQGISQKKALHQARSILESVDAGLFIQTPINRLSGGEKQRVAIARAVVHKPALILADEPTGNLDVDNEKIIMDLLKQLSIRQGAAVVVATHDANLMNLGITVDLKRVFTN